MGTLPFPALPGRGLGEDELELGHVLGVFGVRGEVRLFLHNPGSTLWRNAVAVSLIAPEGRRYQVSIRTRSGAGKRILARLDGLTDRDVAEGLRGYVIAVPRTALPRPAKGEFYHWQILGADAVIDDEVVGTITHVQSTEGVDVLEIEAPGGPWFVPCVKAWVLEVDTEAGRVVLAPGALSEEE